MNGRKTTVTEVSYGRGWFWVGMAVLMCCLSLFCSDVQATLYQEDNSDPENVYGLYWDSGDKILIGSEFGFLKATATTGDNAYGFWNDSGTDCTTMIEGQFVSGGIISGKTLLGSNAYGLYSSGSIYNDEGGINGTITATAYGSYAYAMGSYESMVINGNIGSDANIAATAGGGKAYGLYSWNGLIKIGDIDGEISARVTGGAGGTAYGIYADANLTTGAINGSITADEAGDGAYAMYAGNNIIVGDINGIGIDSVPNIYAHAGGSNAYGLYSENGDIDIDGDMNGIITATAGDYKAAGLRSYNNLNIYGDIDGDVNATAGEHAFGLRSDNGSIYVEGVIDGNITATANNGHRAYGFRTYNGSIDTNDINGNITATAETYWAAGMRSSGTIHTGAINGTIDANATTGSDAYGLYSENGSIYTGDINGVITAFAKTNNAAGLYNGSVDSIYTGAINGRITADANTGSNAYGLYSVGKIDVDGIGKNAVITATAEDWKAVGLYSQNGSIDIDGDMNGTITARAGNQAYGLYSQNGSIDIDGDMNGVITATAVGNRAYGLFSTNGSINTLAINGTITATAGEIYAYGLYSSGGGSIYTLAIDGNITATADYQAYGLFSEGSSLETGDIGGTITATVAHDRAYGLRSWGSITTGDIDGTISATAGEDKVAGLFSEGSLTTGRISGTIDANGRDYAYGILSYGPMDVTVDGGTVSAVAHGGTHAAAIQSGRIATGPLRIDTQPAGDDETDDTVEIVAGSTIVGDIDLGWDGDDADELWLTGDTGTTTLDDNIWNVENIYITGGTWYINGNVYNNEYGTTVNGGILKGTGTLGDLDIDNGTLAPGGSIGTINIDGDLTIGSGGTYEVDVNNSENHDYVSVTGTANLDGTIRGNAIERIRHSFEVSVLDAEGGFDGTEFADVTGTTLFPIFGVDYGSVILQVTMDYAYYADTENQHSVGEAFNYIVEEGLDIDDMNDVLTAIENLPDGDAVNNAYNQIMPQDALGLAEIIRNAMNQYSESVFGRMDSIRNGRQYAMSADSRYLLASTDNSVALPPKTDDWMPFAKGFGVWGDRDAESDIAGYSYNVYGLTGGVDKLVSENTLIGISVGGSRANVNYSQSGTSAGIDSMFCSLYGSYFKDDWHIGLTAAYSHSWYDSQRDIHFDSIDREAKSDHQGNAYSAAVEVGKNFGDKTMILEPVVGMGYTLVQESGYKEKGADSLDLKVDSATSDGIYSKLGVRAAKEFRPEKYPDMILVPHASIFWIHDFADSVELSSSFVGGGSFTTEGREPVRDMFNIGAGLNVYYNKNLRLFIDYGWQSASSFNSDTVQLGAQWSF